ncbi:hypothetical protein [Streptomyces sp. NPDC048508]|uniref:hypothetical protein n=1 Tax=Streptomyces sp. NPDC048508 TaxID=3365561 RepID=UPI0037114E20
MDVDDALRAVDLERSEPRPAVRDLVRLSDAWHGRPDQLAALLSECGRPLTSAEQARLVVEVALDSVTAIAYGSAHSEPEPVERGRRTPARLLAPMTVQGAVAGRVGLRPNAFTASRARG